MKKRPFPFPSCFFSLSFENPVFDDKAQQSDADAGDASDEGLGGR